MGIRWSNALRKQARSSSSSSKKNQALKKGKTLINICCKNMRPFCTKPGMVKRAEY